MRGWKPPEQGDLPEGVASGHDAFFDESDGGEAASDAESDDGMGWTAVDGDPGKSPVVPGDIDPLAAPNGMSTVAVGVFQTAGLFIPQQIGDQNFNAERPPPPSLPESDLPAGTLVWVWDIRDVMTLMQARWEPIMELVCNGNAEGVVLRHSNDLTLVQFSRLPVGAGASAVDVAMALSLPRAALSKEVVEPTPVTEGLATRSILFTGGGLGARAGHDKTIPKQAARCRVSDFDVETTAQFERPETTELLARLRDTPEGELSLPETFSLPQGASAAEYCDIALERLVARDGEGAKQASEAAVGADRGYAPAYLRLWRASLLTGSVRCAQQAENHLALLSKQEPLLSMMKPISAAFSAVDKFIQAQQAPLSLQSTYRFVRVLKSRSMLPGDSFIAKTQVVALTPMLASGVARHCSACGKHLQYAMAWIPCPRGSRHSFCSGHCAERAWESFLCIEEGDSRRGFRSALTLLESEFSGASAAENPDAEHLAHLESARLALRLWAMAAAHVRRIPGASIGDVLGNLGVFPAPDGPSALTPKALYKMYALASVVATDFPAPIAAALPKDVLVKVFLAVHVYRGRLDIPPPPNRSGPGLSFAVVSLLASGRAGDPVFAPASSPSANAALFGTSARDVSIRTTAYVATGDVVTLSA